MEFSIILLILYSNLGTVACAWHRQVRLASLAAAKHTPRKGKTGKLNQQGSRKRFAMQRFFGKRRRNGAKRAVCFGKPPKSEVYGDEKARRSGAVPADPLGDQLPLFPPRMAFYHWFLPFIAPLEFAFSVGYGSIVPRGRQRPQNRTSASLRGLSHSARHLLKTPI